jgi:hypothetical protein
MQKGGSGLSGLGDASRCARLRPPEQKTDGSGEDIGVRNRDAEAVGPSCSNVRRPVNPPTGAQRFPRRRGQIPASGNQEWVLATTTCGRSSDILNR